MIWKFHLLKKFNLCLICSRVRTLCWRSWTCLDPLPSHDRTGIVTHSCRNYSFLGKKISKRFKETRTICFRTILSGKLAFLVFANTASNFVNEESLRIYTNLNTFLECSRSEHGYWFLTNRERNPTVNAWQFPALTTIAQKPLDTTCLVQKGL